MVEVLVLIPAALLSLPAMCARPMLKYWYTTAHDTRQTLQQVSPEIKHLREAMAEAGGKSHPITEHLKRVNYWETFSPEFY